MKLSLYAARVFALLIAVSAASVYAQPIVIDGQFDPAEWAGATSYGLTVNLPGGGTTAGEVFMKNDGANLYFALRIKEPALSHAESIALIFDATRDGVISAGDEGVGLNSSALCNVPKSFYDFFFYTGGKVCPPATLCSDLDMNAGGTTDGNGAVDNDGTWTTHEVWHPRASADWAHDIQFARTPMRILFLTRIVLFDTTGAFGITEYPGPGYSTWASYVIH